MRDGCFARVIRLAERRVELRKKEDGVVKDAAEITLCCTNILSEDECAEIALELAKKIQVNEARTYHEGVENGLYMPLVVKAVLATERGVLKRKRMNDAR